MNLSKKILAGAAVLIALGLGAISGLGGPALWGGGVAGVPAAHAECYGNPPPPEMECAPTPTPTPPGH